MAEKQLFHTVEEDSLKEVVKDSYLLDETILFNNTKFKDIPAFAMAVPVKGMDARRWNNPKNITLHVAIGNKYKSYFVFILTNKYGETMKFALPMEDHAATISTILMTGELYIALNEPKVETKAQRKKNIFKVPVTGKIHEVYRYGLLLFMDKSGILRNPKSKALNRPNIVEEQEPVIEFPQENEAE